MEDSTPQPSSRYLSSHQHFKESGPPPEGLSSTVLLLALPSPYPSSILTIWPHHCFS